jgi:hypothetical protein
MCAIPNTLDHANWQPTEGQKSFEGFLLEYADIPRYSNIIKY